MYWIFNQYEKRRNSADIQIFFIYWIWLSRNKRGIPIFSWSADRKWLMSLLTLFSELIDNDSCWHYTRIQSESSQCSYQLCLESRVQFLLINIALIGQYTEWNLMNYERTRKKWTSHFIDAAFGKILSRTTHVLCDPIS